MLLTMPMTHTKLENTLGLDMGMNETLFHQEMNSDPDVSTNLQNESTIMRTLVGRKTHTV